MWPTTEIRWFNAGILLEQTLSWFGISQPPETPTVQVHEYLLFPGCDTVGVKFREDWFEIKVRRGVSQSVSLLPGIQGVREQWIKWSLPTKGLSMFGPTLHESGPWIKVHKERNKRTFSAESGPLQEVPAGSFPSMGCNIELTRIAVEADPPSWFTLGLEAYGPPPVTPALLEEVVGIFFKTKGPPPGINLTQTNSFGYPNWLMNSLRAWSIGPTNLR